MSKIAQYLQEHLLGEVTTSPDVRRHLAHDASILRLIPAGAVYPRDESDIRKTARFCWQLAERGRVVPLTVRGGGSDISGSALGSGLILLPTAHMNRVLELDPKKSRVVVEPGITYDKLQQTLYTHGLFLGAYPPNGAFATIGGGLGSNAIGEKSLKYGNTLKHVESLRVVLANGELIETGPLSKRDLSKKMGLSNFEGQIYRALDKLLEENQGTIDNLRQAVKGIENGVGYRIEAVKKAGELDLTPLFIGSQGTLGIITESRLKLDPHNPVSVLAMVGLNSLDDLSLVLPHILALKPSLCDFLSADAVSAVNKLNPTQLINSLDVAGAAIHLFVEFDDIKAAQRAKNVKALAKLVEGVDGYVTSSEDSDEQQRYWKLRQSVATILLQPNGPKRAVPLAGDISLPPASLPAFLKEAQRILSANSLPGPMWGHAGGAIIRIYAQLDLAEVGDRQRYFKLSEALYSAAVSQGGSISASGEGRIAAPYVAGLYGQEFANLMRKIKSIFDPHGILNTGVKTNSPEEVIGMLRTDYNVAHRHEHLPRS